MAAGRYLHPKITTAVQDLKQRTLGRFFSLSRMMERLRMRGKGTRNAEAVWINTKVVESQMLEKKTPGWLDQVTT